MWNSFNLMESSANSRPFLLVNTIQNYKWGMQNESAFIANLLNIEPRQDEAFAELWIGTHPNGPSKIIDPDRGLLSLKDWIQEKPDKRLSGKRSEQLTNQLPYLFKVLSAQEMLSIQTHPNKSQAQQLHATDPEHYPDANHKPELAIAIDKLDALIGFISDNGFSVILDKTPELKELLEINTAETSVKEGVGKILSMVKHSPEKISACIENLCLRLSSKPDRSAAEDLILKQSAIYGYSDVGLLFILLLNRITLEAGEAVFLGPGIPHAYLKGNIIECMANSDNVVRLGLTEKFCDPDALIKVLDFKSGMDFYVEARSDGQVTEYPTPTTEFRVKSIALDEGNSFTFEHGDDLKLFLVLKGEIKLSWCTDNNSCDSVFTRGDSFVTPANLSSFSIYAKADCLLYLVEIP
jgi:mannose-6-phosphate isomerase